MNEEQQKELIFSKVIKPKLENDIKSLGDNFKKIVEKYSFLFNDNIKETKDVFIEFYLDQLDTRTYQIELDYNNFYKRVSDSKKQELYEKTMNKFISTLTMDSINDSLTEEQVQTKETNNINDIEMENHPTNDSDDFPM